MDGAQPGCSPWSTRTDHGATVAGSVGRLVAEHLTELSGVEDVADAVGYSPYHLMRLFARETGAGLGAVITARRFQRAKELLLDGAGVTDSCMESGFSSVGTFSRRFRAEVGVQPSEFARLGGAVEDWLGRAHGGDGSAPPPSPATIEVQVRLEAGPDAGVHDVFVGLYPGGVASARPVSGGRCRGSGRALLPAPPDGRYRVLATALPAHDAGGMLAPPRYLAGRDPAPVRIVDGRAERDLVVVVTVAPLWVPPVVTAVPVVAMEADGVVWR